jgi:hypothetical protein
MSWIEILVLAIVQGLTEFIPISSTAHLRIVPALFGWSDPGAAFSAVLQIGTLVAVFMALQQLGIATNIVTTAFAILFGAIALALALAFGLGNRDLAGEVTREWYEQYREERDAAVARERAAVAADEAELAAEVYGPGDEASTAARGGRGSSDI